MLSIIKRTPDQAREYEHTTLMRALDAIRKGQYELAMGFTSEVQKDFAQEPSADSFNQEMLAFATVFFSYASVLKEMGLAEAALLNLSESTQIGFGTRQFCKKSLKELKTAQMKLKNYMQ